MRMKVTLDYMMIIEDSMTLVVTITPHGIQGPVDGEGVARASIIKLH